MCSIFIQSMVLCVITMYVYRAVMFGCIDVHHSLSMHVCNWCAGFRPVYPYGFTVVYTKRGPQLRCYDGIGSNYGKNKETK